MEFEMVVWSDNDSIEQVANIIHDKGYKTAEIRKESLGSYEDGCNWSWCKANMVDSICVDLNNAMGQIVPTEQVEEQPMYRYVAVFIVGDDDDDDDNKEEDNKEEQTMEKKANVVLNIGCTTKNGVALDVDSVINAIGKETDCTITKTVGFYHGERENSLRIDIYDIAVDRAISMANDFAYTFNQECVALTVDGVTKFVVADLTEDEFLSMCDELEK